MLLFRLTRKKYLGSLSGAGAALFPGRWNVRGQEAIYTSETRSLALVEVLVHLSKDLVPADYFLQTILIPADLHFTIIPADTLPDHWYDSPPPHEVRVIGSTILQHHLMARVPSAIVLGEWNQVINPHFPGFERISLLNEEPFFLDPRLFFSLPDR